MLNFNSKDNLLLNLLSSNSLRGYLKSNPEHRRSLMSHLKKVKEETGELPYKKYPGGIKEVLTEILGSEFTDKFKEYTLINSYKHG